MVIIPNQPEQVKFKTKKSVLYKNRHKKCNYSVDCVSVYVKSKTFEMVRKSTLTVSN